MIELFDHNQVAYDVATSQLAQTGRTCVIHPTGTGKSFIAFKWVEDNQDKQFLWLSPSENIYKTQLENVKKISFFIPTNITFMTYAKLSRMTIEEIQTLVFDGIILDEMHRVGASVWGEGVKTLLTAAPDALVLGLTATPIRYLDDQRDMAAELFDNCVADSMSLGEAIGKGILPAPKYVTAMYSYSLDYEKYANRLKRINAATRRKAENILQRLRRALELADGLDAIFARHLKKGKYIAFCANKAHMLQMMVKCGNWFQSIDADAHLYSVWADSPTAEQDYIRFTKDETDHLRILFSIDMFNEGIHVGDLDGVILFRATISPIIYKQQIGRALSAQTAGTPLIIDVVNNFENLYSIRALEKDIKDVVTHYRGYEPREGWLPSSFELVDEVRECRQLFEQLEETLALSWEEMYQEAKRYFEVHGDLNIEKQYRTEDGVPLGIWITTQRTAYRDGRLGEYRVELLNAIGMNWDTAHEMRWENGYRHAIVYKEEHGNLDISANYVCSDGYPLGKWIVKQRALHRVKQDVVEKSQENGRFSKLSELGIKWDFFDEAFDEGLREAKGYYELHGDLNVPARYVTDTGYKLGAWLTRVRRRYTGVGEGTPLTTDQIRSMEEIGMEWRDKYQRRWEESYRVAEQYYTQHGSLRVPKGYEVDGIRLDKWVQRQRKAGREKRLDPVQREKLTRLGLVIAG